MKRPTKSANPDPDTDTSEDVPMDPYERRWMVGGPWVWHAVEHAHVWGDSLSAHAEHATWNRVAVNWDHGHPGLVQILVTGVAPHGSGPKSVGLLVSSATAKRLAEELRSVSDVTMEFDDFMRVTPSEDSSS